MPDLLDQSVSAFCEATAAKQSTPGGGSVAGVAGALAAALGEMSLNYSRGKKSFADQADLHIQLSARLKKLRALFLRLIDEDMQAFEMLQQASGMDPGIARDEAHSLALAVAIDIPREMAKLSLALLRSLESLSTCCTKWLISDLLAAASLASATCDLCDFNVRINATSLPEDDAKRDILMASSADRTTARALFESLESAVEL